MDHTSVVILLPFPDEEHHSQHDRHEFRDDDGKPDAVDSPDQGQQQDCRQLKYQCPQERDQRGSQTVIERREEPDPKIANPMKKKDRAKIRNPDSVSAMSAES